MAFCTSCGAPLEGSFCTQCGAKSGEEASAGPASQVQSPVQAPARKSKALTYVLFGCGGLIVIAIVSAIAFGLFVRQKAGDFSKNPAMAAARMVAAMNPDIEVVSADEATGRITLREKKTGKTVTMDFREIQKGRITFEGDEGESVDIHAQGGGDSGSMTVRSKDGTMVIGQGSLAQVPRWVPRCPGAQPAGSVSSQGQNEDGGMLHLKCDGSVEEVAAYYERELKREGMTVKRQAILSGETNMVMLTAQEPGSGHGVNATVLASGEGTVAQLVYQTKR